MPKERPDPEKLLQRAQNEEENSHRGKLKIFLGASPGVGKTYAMLQEAHDDRVKGLDVIIGVVETHGRKEVENLITEFEKIPRAKIHYRDKELSEFDLDAALKRHPAIILMDEMAHTNAPGTRHKKRWQDINEILNRGIDVYTTLNVQHIESLSDDVAQIIHAPIKETVPDSMIDKADMIELVDITPEELLARLKDGKVYYPEQAEIAAESFFRRGNLIALRELALLTTAQRVGTDVILYRQNQGIQHIWPVKDKILVCVGPGSPSLKLIRAAKRIANSLQAEWMAIYVETPKLQSSIDKKNSAIQNLKFAEQLGAKTKILSGFDIVKEIMMYAREQNATQIMIWKTVNRRWHDLFFRNLADEIVRHSGEIDVYIMTGQRSDVEIPKSNPIKEIINWKAYIGSMMIIGLATLVNFILSAYLASSNLIMVYLLAVTAIALFGEVGPSVLGSLLSVLAYDFFFVPPYYSFAVADLEYFFTLLVMLIVSQIISHLTILSHRQTQNAQIIEKQTLALYTLSQLLAAARNEEKIVDIGSVYIDEIFNSDVLVFIPINNHLEIQGKNKSKIAMDEKELSIAKWVYDSGQTAGFGTDTLSDSKALYLPLVSENETIGVIRILPRNKVIFTTDQKYLLESCAAQIAFAWHKFQLHRHQ